MAGQTSIEDYPPFSTGKTAVDPDGGIWLYQPNIPGGLIELTAPTPEPPVNVTPPTLQIIGGPDPVVGVVIAMSAGSWSPTGDRTNAWTSGGTTIPAATGVSYTAQLSDVGNLIGGSVTMTNADGSATAVASNTIGPIVEPADEEVQQAVQQPQARAHTGKHGKTHHARSVHR